VFRDNPLAAQQPSPASRDGARPLIILSVAGGYGGAERDIEILARHIPLSRRLVIFATNPYHLEELRKIKRPNLEIEYVDLSGRFIPRAARRLILRFLALRPAAILSNTADSLAILSHATHRLPGLDAQAFVFVRDFLWWNNVELLASVPRATLLVPDRSVLEKPHYLGRFIWPEGPLRALVMPNLAELPAQASPPPADAAFLHLATVNGFKGHRYLVETMALLRMRDPRLKALSYGHRPITELYAEIAQQIAETETADVLALHDHVPDPSPLLTQCRAVLVTSVSDHGGPETFGRTIAEAWAHGRPVIAFAVGAPGHLIRHGEDGLLIAEKDVEGLAEAMLRLHREPDFANRLGANGRARAAREFAPALVVPQILDIFDGHWRHPAAATAAPTPKSGRGNILFDVSLSLGVGWKTPVGMSRVEQNVADYVFATSTTPIQLVCNGGAEGGFRRLQPLEREFLAHRADAIGTQAAAELAAEGPPRRPSTLRRPWTLAIAALSLLAGARAASRRGLRRWLLRTGERAIARPSPPPLSFAAGDTLICVSNPWDHVPAPLFHRLRKAGGRLVLVVHDLMVWETPHLTAGRDPQQYAENMLATIAEADAIVAISRHTAGVLADAFSVTGRPLPRVTVAPPAAALTPNPINCPPGGLDRTRPFAMLCSTIEVRKNHLLLLHLWERLRQDLPAERLPQLIFVGRWGWGVDAVRLAVERNWRLAPHVRVFEDVRDDALRWLYRNARFTLLPAFNEGFGLPAGESLAVGTPVLISNHPALIEATEGLMPAIDPFDLPAWQRAVTSLCLDDCYLEVLREKARTYRGPHPNALAGAVMAAAQF
jgi:glycosyltransferase involved in cell wall biosynthesis